MTRDEFDAPTLGLAWNFLRNPHAEDWSLAERPGFLRLHGSTVTLNDRDSPALICRRQTALACKASARLSFDPADWSISEEAGLTVFANDKNHCEIGIVPHDPTRQVIFRRTQNGAVTDVKYKGAGGGDIIFSVVARPLSYEFFYQSPDGDPISLGTAKTQDFSSEKVGGFTGVYFGMYATGNGHQSTVPADFDWFQYDVESK
jgi:alpha-N-arabinofuranosidase